MKSKFTVLFLGLFAVTLITNSCDKADDNPFNCSQLAIEYASASTDYTLDPSSGNCIELKNAIEDYLDSDCPVLTDTYRAELQAELNGLDCN